MGLHPTHMKFSHFYADFKDIIFEMIHWTKMVGRHFQGTKSQALPPILTVTNGSNPPLLLPKRVGAPTLLGRVGPWCPKSVRYPFSSNRFFQKLCIQN